MRVFQKLRAVLAHSRMKAGKASRNGERGNVLFYILIAVALIAALSYAVSSTSRGGGATDITAERANLAASEILEYANIVSNAVAQLQLRGVEPSELCFDAPGWSDTSYNYAGCSDNFNRVFHVEGGGVSLITVPDASLTPDASNPEEWRFTAVNEISGVGSTCGDASCSELIMRANNINEEVCIQINNILGVGAKNAAPPEDDDTGGDEYIGTFGYMETVADETAGAPAFGRKAACMYQTGGTPKYFFYKVLIAR